MNFLEFSKTISIDSSLYPDELETERLIIKKTGPQEIATFYRIYLKNTTQNIGGITFIYDGAIWYNMKSEYQNKGYMIEALTEVVEKIDVSNCYMSIKHDNEHSISIAKRINFQKVKEIDDKYIYRKKA